MHSYSSEIPTRYQFTRDLLLGSSEELRLTVWLAFNRSARTGVWDWIAEPWSLMFHGLDFEKHYWGA